MRDVVNTTSVATPQAANSLRASFVNSIIVWFSFATGLHITASHDPTLVHSSPPAATRRAWDDSLTSASLPVI
ncbi:hypothetical protein ACET3X_004630 [Alternaria dauci]|uniref:Uncharacterized protein n=1 Tax=Alternaria dauci TaxID=48095 RepID=A0ABR3UNW5_9PLEO